MIAPLRLKPVVKEAVWGGRWLSDVVGRDSPVGALIGESWEAYSESVVDGGELDGLSLADVLAHHGREILGIPDGCTRFPLLVKLIEARQNLSVQVHPDDALAMELEGHPYGKTEFWYILDAPAGAEIVCGLVDPSIEDADLAASLNSPGIEPWNRVPVRTGDVVYLPAGTVHALTAGLIVYELQQDCDITYRLFDWGRVGRELHIEKGLRALRRGDSTASVTRPEMTNHAGYSVGQLAVSPYFRASLYRVSTQADMEPEESFTILTCVGGTGGLLAIHSGWTGQIKFGDTLLIPRGESVRVENSSSDTVNIIAATLP